MTIKNYTAHDINVYRDAEYDASVRKYRGGEVALTIPRENVMLNASKLPGTAENLNIEGVEIEVTSPAIWADVTPIPDGEFLCIVSAMYVSACQALGIDTSRLLTMGPSVVDSNNRVIGTVGFSRN